MADSAASAAAASSAGHKRKFDAPNGASNGAASSSHKKGGDWKKPRTGDRDAGKPWAKPAANATKIGPDGRPLPHPVGGNGKPWIKAADWKANTPVAYSRQERKDMKRERKASKPNADVIAEANKLWQVSLVNMTAAQRAAKIDELLAAIKGKVSEIGLKHDASRAIQIAVKHATEAQKHALLAEVKGQFKKLADDHYGHYIVIKMLSNDTRKGDVKKACLAEFKGHVGKLSAHPDSAKVLDFLFASAKQKEQLSLLQEFYSPEFVVFGADESLQGKSLAEIVQAKPEKKMQMLENLRKYLDKSLEKSMLMFRFIHALLVQYLSVALVADTVDLLQGLHQFIPALHHSPDGCRVVAHLLSVSTAAKDRKALLKHFKGVVANMAERAEGVHVINTALDVVDDTVLLDKVVLAELLPTLTEQITHQYSARIYLHVLNASEAAAFAPEERANYATSGHFVLNPNDALAKQVLAKKDPAQKRLELLGVFLHPLLQALATRPDTLAALLRSNTGHHLLLEVIREAWRLQHDPEAQAAATANPADGAAAAGGAGKKKKGGKGGAASGAAPAAAAAADGEEGGDDAAAPVAAGGSRFPASLAKNLSAIQTNLGYVLDSIVAECARPLGAEDDGAAPAAESKNGAAAAGGIAGVRGAKSNALEDRFGHYVVKRVLSHLSPSPLDFASKLVSDAIEPQLLAMASTNRPAFVLATFFETPALKTQAELLRKKLKPLLAQINQQVSSGVPKAPVKNEDAMEDTASAPKWKKPVHATHSTTHAGVTLLTKLVQGLPTDKHPQAAAGKKGAAASVAAAPAAAAAAPVAPATPASKPAAAAAAKSGKKSSAAPVKMELDEAEADEPAAAAVAPAAAPATPGHRRQWTHSNLDGTKNARLHRTPVQPAAAAAIAEEDGEEEAAAVAPTPAKAAKTPAKGTAKKAAAAGTTGKKKKQQSEDMEE